MVRVPVFPLGIGFLFLFFGLDSLFSGDNLVIDLLLVVVGVLCVVLGFYCVKKYWL
jgi:hypothetical protein